MTKAIIEAKQLTKVYVSSAEQIVAVNSIDFSIIPGELVALMGPSGSGKTTLLDMLGCLDQVSSGELIINGRDVANMNEAERVAIRRNVLGFIFQDFSLIPSLTAVENVMLPLYFARRKQSKKDAVELLKKVGLSHRISHLPKQLSGGEKQRVAIARSLITRPNILLADEPTGHLDTKVSQDIFALFKELNESDNLTIIVATHNPELGQQAKRIIFLKDGNIVSREDSNLFSR